MWQTDAFLCLWKIRNDKMFICLILMYLFEQILQMEEGKEVWIRTRKIVVFNHKNFAYSPIRLYDKSSQFFFAKNVYWWVPLEDFY